MPSAGEDQLAQLQRPGLALDDGRVVIAYGQNAGDCPGPNGPAHGYVVSIPETGGPLDYFQVGSGKDRGAVWMGGASPVVDPQGNVYVADRSNHRMQVFDNNLALKAVYDNIGDSWTVCVSPGPHQYLFTSNSNPNGNPPGSWDITGEIYKMELDGTIIGKFGHASKEFGGFQVVHMMDCRNPDEIVVGEIESWRVQKLILKPDAMKKAEAR